MNSTVTAPSPYSNQQPATARPSRRDPAIIPFVAQDLAAKVREWDGDNAAEHACDEYVAELTAALEFHTDGYELAQELERSAHIFPDAALVEILDCASSVQRKQWMAAIKQWVPSCGLVPPPLNLTATDGRHLGTVISNDLDTATSVLQRPQDGMGSGLIVNWEDLTEA